MTTQSAQSASQEREAFEAFAQNCPMGRYDVQRKGDGYWSSHTQIMWDSWCAALAAAPQKAAGAEAAEHVAVVGTCWSIMWAGSEPIATLLARHPGVRIGSKLYTAEALAAAHESGRQQGMAQEHALWQLAASSQAIEAAAQPAAVQQGAGPVRKAIEALLEVADGVPAWHNAGHAAKLGREALAILAASPPPAAPAVPPGWKLVPVEPTPEMVKIAVQMREGPAVYKVLSQAGLHVLEDEAADEYRAMLAATPQPADRTSPKAQQGAGR